MLMAARFHLGSLIRDEREKRGWSQARLGEEARRFRLAPDEGRINVNTVSKIEGSPFSSEHGTVIRLLAALGLSLADVERETGSPFLSNEAAPARSAPDKKSRAPSEVRPARKRRAG